METPNNGGWSHPSGPGQSPPNGGNRQPMQQRSMGGYPSNHGLPQVPPMQMPASAPMQPQSQGHFFGASQPNNNPLPSLSGLPQSSPRQASHPAAQHQRLSPPPPMHLQGPGPSSTSQPGPGYSLPAIGQAIQNGADRDRQFHEAEMREAEERHHQQEREYLEQQRLGEQQRSSPRVHAASSIPLHQPIARTGTNLFAPNGLLSNANAEMGGPAGPMNTPGTSIPHGLPMTGPAARPYQPPNALPTHSQGGSLGTAAAAAAQSNAVSPGVPPPPGVNAGPPVAQGQQPILNDALSYLDLVKVRFQDQPEVYNRFLDIMKDFKSQDIDTPGVIERVSTLFNGHPQLIEGFNTFLPPGYRIEAGWDNDPNQIRVTTPMGTTTCRPSMISGQLGSRTMGPAVDGAGLPPQQGGSEQFRGAETGWVHAAHRDGNAEGAFSPNARAVAVTGYGQHTPSRQGPVPYGPRDGEMQSADAATLAHQEQRGVSQLSNAVNVAVDNQAGRAPLMQTAAADGNTGMLGRPIGGVNGAGIALPGSTQAGVEKRGPIEFNHAINYVNKIKVRYASHPDVYKNFLEILQTYQRESKPIQDVYGQVTELFHGAPDLLEDFKQFLPESAAHAKSQAAARHGDEVMTSNVRGEPSYISGMPRLSQTPKPDRLPPVGNFAPPTSVGKESKKRRAGGAPQAAMPGSSAAAPDIGSSRANGQAGHVAKRQKIAVGKNAVTDIAIPSPSLVPELPTPLPPTTEQDSADRLAWFERVKKYISNRQSYNEFLKLCNLFSQGIIDKNTLAHKAEAFFGQNADLLAFFRNFVEYSGADEVIENRPVQSSTKVVLSNCRALGPSYRLLPKRERFAKCSGRDEMCHEVLNDEWASHPTWASEDSGFISHRKNIYEEALYRMEEERHDYDFNIETCLRTIQLLEPIVAQINAMDPEERPQYKLPLGLGGQSEAIWQRVIKKLYDRPMGCRVVDQMITRPTQICSVILDRLKEKVEKWKQAQREWEKVWRDQTHKQFWKSLDHQGINAKQENKRSFQPKALHTDIQARYEEQRRQKQIKPSARIPNHQLDLVFGDVDVLQDTCHMLLTYLRTSYQGGDQTKIESFLKNFFPTFFGLEKDSFVARMADVYSETPPNEEEEEANTNEETPTRGRRTVNGKKNLLRGVLDPSKQGKKDAREESKESTPDVTSMDEDSSTQTDGQSDQLPKLDSSDRWMEHPVSGNSRDRQNVKHNELFTRKSFSLYANLHIYCFMRMLAMLYERLSNVKGLESAVQDDVRRALTHKPATELLIADRSPTEFFEDTSPTANYYRQVIKLCEASLEHTVEVTKVEETLRRFYLHSGWQLYSFDKMLGAIVKFASQVIMNDVKDRSNDIMNLFFANRKESQTTHQIEIDYRKQVEKLAKDGDVYRIIFNSATQHVTIRLLKKDDQTFETTGMPPDVNWSYYVTAYGMRDWTEGVPRAGVRWPFLRRSLPRDVTGGGGGDNSANDEDALAAAARRYPPMLSDEGLTIRIAPNNYRLLWERHTADAWVNDARVRARGTRGADGARAERKARFESRFVEKPKWAEGLSREESDKVTADFRESVGVAEA